MSDQTCCEEFGRLDRRTVLRAGALAGTTTMVGSAVVTTRPASAASADSVLVVLSLRGAADGLSLVVPYADPVLRAARPGIHVPESELLATDGFFGLHPALDPLLPTWRAGRMAAIHAAGMLVPNRSHFAAMEEVEDAAPGSGTRSGWLNRLVGDLPGGSPLQGFSLGEGVLPISLGGPEPVFASGSVDNVGLLGEKQGKFRRERERSLSMLWNRDRTVLGDAMRQAMAAVDDFQPAQQQSSRVGTYPSSDLGRALADVARVVRGDVGVEVVTVDQGNWDMHVNVGNLSGGRMVKQAADLAQALAAFLDDVRAFRDEVTVVVLSEFGRRVKQNTNRGLDHGHGSVMLVLGAGVRGGYYASWPGLENTEDADLAVTTDYRQVLAEVVHRRFPAAAVSSVFPGLVYDPVGFMRG